MGHFKKKYLKPKIYKQTIWSENSIISTSVIPVDDTQVLPISDWIEGGNIYDTPKDSEW